jgi:hypothetical protein
MIALKRLWFNFRIGIVMAGLDPAISIGWLGVREIGMPGT